MEIFLIQKINLLSFFLFLYTKYIICTVLFAIPQTLSQLFSLEWWAFSLSCEDETLVKLILLARRGPTWREAWSDCPKARGREIQWLVHGY